MSSDPPNRFDRPGGGKIYRHPITGEVFDSVTSALDIFDKDGLKRWAAMMAAEAAFDLLPQLNNSVLQMDCGNTYNRCYQKHGRENICERCPCGKCERCLYRRLAHRHDQESSRRSAEGTEVHSMINQWVLNNGMVVTSSPEAQPYFRTFLRWAEDYGLRPGRDGSWVQTETTLLNREHGYAGTSDAALNLERRTAKATAFLDKLGEYTNTVYSSALIRVDYKTREKPDERLYNDMPLQGEAYERCEVAMLPDGTEHPAPRTVARCVLQLRPDVDADGNKVANPYTFTPMRSGDRVFATFLGLLEAYRWMNDDGGKKAFGLEMLNPASQTPILKAAQVPGDALAGMVAMASEISRQAQQAGEAHALPMRAPVGAAVVEVDLPAPAREFPSGEFDDPWEFAPDARPWPPDPAWEEPVAAPPPEPTPPPEPKKAPAKRAPAKKAATKKDEPNGSATVEKSMREQAARWPVGAPHTHLLDDQIPF